jgi:hypothetical protein
MVKVSHGRGVRRQGEGSASKAARGRGVRGQGEGSASKAARGRGGRGQGEASAGEASRGRGVCGQGEASVGEASRDGVGDTRKWTSEKADLAAETTVGGRSGALWARTPPLPSFGRPSGISGAERRGNRAIEGRRAARSMASSPGSPRWPARRVTERRAHHRRTSAARRASRALRHGSAPVPPAGGPRPARFCAGPARRRAARPGLVPAQGVLRGIRAVVTARAALVDEQRAGRVRRKGVRVRGRPAALW